MPRTSTNTEVGEAGTETAASDLAAKRRGRRNPKPAEHPVGEAPAQVHGETPPSVIANRTTVSGFGSGGPARPVGGVWMGEPLVLTTQPYAPGGQAVESPRYVIAECEANEHTIPPNCKTPVVRLLWRKGDRVRRDLYDAVMAEHAKRAEQGVADQPIPAALPEGVDQLPPDVVASPATVEGAAEQAALGGVTPPQP